MAGGAKSEAAPLAIFKRLNAVWDARVARARLLSSEQSGTTGILTFYAALAAYQQSLLQQNLANAGNEATAARDGEATSLLDVLDVESVLPAVPAFLSWLSRTAPAHLATAAADMHRFDLVQWRDFMVTYLAHDWDDVDAADATILFVIECVLQPFAEWHARSRPDNVLSSPSQSGTPQMASRMPHACHICGGLPVVAVLREAGQGARRTLLCGLCLTESEYPRVVCPRCGEQQFDALPVYRAEQFPHVRIAACDSCRTYLKTIDLTKDGLAVPLVDDLASLSLDLWAREQDYTRLRPNLLRI